MKKSRAGKSILVIVLLVGVVIVAGLGASLLSDTDNESSGLTELFGRGNKIGVVKLEGTIMQSDETLKQLRKFAKRSSVRAIVLRINSPGGAVAPAQEIYREIGKIKEKKPVVASMETVGASAAYYIASNSDRVVSSKGTITGSIGVIMMLTDLHQLIEKIGVNVNVIKAGKFKDIGTGVRPLTEEERKILVSFADEIHEQFISDVAEGRKGKIDKEKLRTIADGRFFSGEKAKEMGLVDDIGNFYDAVKIAATMGGIRTEAELVYPKKKWENYLELLMESTSGFLSGLMERTGLIQLLPALPGNSLIFR